MSPVDVVLTTALKSILSMSPCRLVNMSFSSDVLPSALKQGGVSLLLKKSGLDPSEIMDYRPIMNLSMMSKILETLALRRPQPYMMLTGNLSELQSVY